MRSRRSITRTTAAMPPWKPHAPRMAVVKSEGERLKAAQDEAPKMLEFVKEKGGKDGAYPVCGHDLGGDGTTSLLEPYQKDFDEKAKRRKVLAKEWKDLDSQSKVF